jgi:site-specific DNA-methyltransferase (adenine-specific)
LEREVVGKQVKARNKGCGPGIPTLGAESYQHKFDITAPATPEARLWEGYGTALKPAYEPVLLAMKPNDGTYAQNALKYRVAGLNIDAGRIPSDNIAGTSRSYSSGAGWDRPWKHDENASEKTYQAKLKGNRKAIENGRFPANMIIDSEVAAMLDEQSGISRSSRNMRGLQGRHDVASPQTRNIKNYSNTERGHSDRGGASRFFYCAKASSSERGKFNDHPTVKPLKLITYLLGLLKPPGGGTVIDPFGGSGTTALAARSAGLRWMLCELEEKSCRIAIERFLEACRADNLDRLKRPF